MKHVRDYFKLLVVLLTLDPLPLLLRGQTEGFSLIIQLKSNLMFNFADAANDYQAFLEDERDRKLEAERLKKTSSTKSDTLSESKDDGSLTREF